MKTKNVIYLIIIVGLITVIFLSLQGSQDDTAYVEELKKEREENNHFMKTSGESPMKDQDSFQELSYYPPDLKYRIVADLVPIESKKMVILKTNDGKEQRYIEYGYADFKLDGINNRLLILEGVDIGPIKGKLFLAFGDETSAVETYGAGRYLDLKRTPGSATIMLDFNRAYNPYCAYNDTYSCPLPPPENLLKVAIKAGEKVYKK